MNTGLNNSAPEMDKAQDVTLVGSGVELLKAKIAKEFLAPLAIVELARDILPDLPEKGNLKITEVLKSEYFFG